MNETIEHAGLAVEVVRRPRRRRTAEIRIADGRIAVIVPAAASRRWIARLIEARRDWIDARLAEQAGRPPAPVRHYREGETLPFAGHDVTLSLRNGRHRRVELDGGILRVTLPARDRSGEPVRRQLVAWYRERALDTLRARCRRLAPAIGVEPAAVRIRTYRARWGSCSNRGVLTFDWRLVMAPATVVDHVVIHELCHLIHMDHGPGFRACIARHDPDPAAGRDWLRRHGHLLVLPAPGDTPSAGRGL